MSAPQRAYPTLSELIARRVADRRAAALSAVAKADAVARAAGGRLLVFGSLATGRFHEKSDIDIVLFDVPADRSADLVAEIFTICEDAGIQPDVIDERHLGPSLRARVMRDGRDPSDLD
ncbi:MAG TPA: nucleotidyltransferase domain-containing protein [Azospirillaceae bacterium]|nr:nucleotidyltransferase domain-containing protein [Azospirillaceae bacterium]